jgi:hypothetical protein
VWLRSSSTKNIKISFNCWFRGVNFHMYGVSPSLFHWYLLLFLFVGYIRSFPVSSRGLSVSRTAISAPYRIDQRYADRYLWKTHTYSDPIFAIAVFHPQFFCNFHGRECSLIRKHIMSHIEPCLSLKYEGLGFIFKLYRLAIRNKKRADQPHSWGTL